MSYLSSNDARRQNATAEVDGFSTPEEELFLCTCHGKRWPLSMLRMENGGHRHCPNQANPQGGSIDRDMLRDYDRVELERRAVDDAAAVQWPISPLETLSCLETIEPRSQIVSLGGFTATILLRGENLSASNVVNPVAADSLWPGVLEFDVIAVAADGLSILLTFISPARTYIPPPPAPHFPTPRPPVDVNLVFDDVVYETVLLLR